jgi:hypothetical protein
VSERRRDPVVTALGRLREAAGGPQAGRQAERVYGRLLVVQRSSDGEVTLHVGAQEDPEGEEPRPPEWFAAEILGEQAQSSGQAEYAVFRRVGES